MRIKLRNEDLGEIYRRVNGIVNKIEEGGLDYYQTINTLQRIFDNGGQTINPGVVAPVTSFKTAYTNLDFWLAKTEEFSKKYLGVEVDLRKRFVIPSELPWQSAIPVFDPGIDNRMAKDLALKQTGLVVWEDVDVMKYSGSEASTEPTLHLIQNSIRPDEDTMEMSPDQLVATGKNWLDLRGYILASGLYHFVTGEYLDPQTFAWFPNSRLAGGQVACGKWSSPNHRVKLSFDGSGYQSDFRGSRLTIPVLLVS